MKIEQGMESPRQGNAENDPRRGGYRKTSRRAKQRVSAKGRRKTIPKPLPQRQKRLLTVSAQRVERQAARRRRKKALDAAQLKAHTSRLQFSEAERATPELQKSIRKSEKAADRLDAARAAIPKQTKIKKERVLTKRKARQRRAFPLKRRISPKRQVAA